MSRVLLGAAATWTPVAFTSVLQSRAESSGSTWVWDRDTANVVWAEPPLSRVCPGRG